MPADNVPKLMKIIDPVPGMYRDVGVAMNEFFLDHSY